MLLQIPVSTFSLKNGIPLYLYANFTLSLRYLPRIPLLLYNNAPYSAKAEFRLFYPFLSAVFLIYQRVDGIPLHPAKADYSACISIFIYKKNPGIFQPGIH